jgi:hypothetical protein
MANALYDMINAKITEIIFIHDYWQITTDKYRLSIYNPIKYKANRNVFDDMCDYYVSRIVNHIIVDIISKEEELIFELDNKCFIVISLADKDYCGPEAASVCFTTGEVRVIS